MNDRPADGDDLDERASLAYDTARDGGSPVPAALRHRVEQFDQVRRVLLDDADAPSADRLDAMLEVALAEHRAPGGTAGDGGSVVRLGPRRRRQLRIVSAAAATTLVLVGAGLVALGRTSSTALHEAGGQIGSGSASTAATESEVPTGRPSAEEPVASPADGVDRGGELPDDATVKTEPPRPGSSDATAGTVPTPWDALVHWASGMQPGSPPG